MYKLNKCDFLDNSTRRTHQIANALFRMGSGVSKAQLKGREISVLRSKTSDLSTASSYTSSKQKARRKKGKTRDIIAKVLDVDTSTDVSSTDSSCSEEEDCESVYLRLIDLAQLVDLDQESDENALYSEINRYILTEFYGSFFQKVPGGLNEQAQFRLKVANLILETDVLQFAVKVSYQFLRDIYITPTVIVYFSIAHTALGLLGNFSDVSDEFTFQLVKNNEFLLAIKDYLQQAKGRVYAAKEEKLSVSLVIITTL